MTPHDRSDFNGVLNRLAMVFGRDLDERTGDAYFESLQDLSLSTVRICADTHTRYGRFFPKPHELRPKDATPRTVLEDKPFRDGVALANARLDRLAVEDRTEWLRQVSDRVYELGRARGMPDGLIAHKLATYQPGVT